jgi:hypothetical protein
MLDVLNELPATAAPEGETPELPLDAPAADSGSEELFALTGNQP